MAKWCRVGAITRASRGAELGVFHKQPRARDDSCNLDYMHMQVGLPSTCRRKDEEAKEERGRMKKEEKVEQR